MELVYALLGAGAASLAMIVGAGLAAWRTPSQNTRSTIGHLAGGVVCGVVAAELVPEILQMGNPLSLAIGFVAGTAMMISAERMAQSFFEERGNTGFLLATGLDVAVDGVLIGFAFALATDVGWLLVLAFVFELLALGLAVGTRAAGATTTKPLMRGLRNAFVLALPVIPAAAIGNLLLGSAGIAFRQGLMGFATAVMLFLAIEELLKEAHEGEERPLATSAFFAGFLLLVLLELAQQG